MGTSVGQQLNQFYYFCGLGFFLGIYYEVFRLIRLALELKRRMIFIADVVFFVTAAFITLLFSLAVSDGVVRGYFVAGLFAGFFAYYFTIGKLVMKVANRVIKVVITVWSFIWKVVFSPFKLINKIGLIVWKKALKPIFVKILGFFHKKAHVFYENVKKGLQRRRKIVYNQGDTLK